MKARVFPIAKRWMMLISLLFIIYHLSFSPVRAQVGSWRAYMAYSDIQQIVKADDNLFVLASNNLYQYNLTDQSITTYDKVNGLSDTYITHIAWNKKVKKLIAVYQNSNIDLVDLNGNITNVSALYRKTMTEDKTIDSLTIDDVYCYLYARFGIVKLNMQRAEISDTYTKNRPDYPTGLPVLDKTDYDNYLSLVASVKPEGPKYNYFCDSKIVNGTLYTTAGYFLSGKADLFYPGIVQVYNGNDWQIYQERIDTITGYEYMDNNCIDVDPLDNNHVAVGGRCGLYEFKDGKLLKYHNQQNSLLRGAMDRGRMLDNSYTLINGVKYDSQGNLWVLNSQTKGVNLLELTTDGQWINHYQSGLADNDSIGLRGLGQMMIDSRGLIWFVNSNWNTPAAFCYNRESDKLIKYGNFVNQDGTSYVITSVNCVAEDMDGNIWVGTNQGPFMIQNQEAGTDNATYQQIKVPRNDGSDYADYLLSGVNVSSISIDGGNRKWFGTSGTGAFLISADNMEQLQYFKSDNSYLLSNTIMSIAVNQQSGEVFFLTDEGLCSYFSDATEAISEMSKDNIYAYPNPVTPDFTGLITINGFSINANVKICTSSGKLVAEGRSNGGTFTWDGCDQQGRRVASGIYMVISATSDGKKGTVCKVAVIR